MKSWLLLLLPLAAAIAGAARPAIVGSWDCVAKDERGSQTAFVLDVKQDAERLSATLQSKETGDVFTLQDVTFTGSDLRFRLRINATEVVEVTANVQGDRFEGQFAGKDSGRGSFQGARRIDLTGEWSGQWETSPDGGPGPHYMKLSQEGEKVTGTAGPSSQQTIAIRNGKFVNGALTFDIVVPNGLSIQFDFKLDRDTLRGDAVMKMNGEERKLRLAASRMGQ